MSAWKWETAPCKYSGGNGTTDDPYQIATAADLIALGESPDDYDKHFILTADIDLDPNLPGRKVFDRAVVAPDTDPTDKYSSFQGSYFNGALDGNGHAIVHLTVTGANYLGLFGGIGSAARISNLALTDVDIEGVGDRVGGIAGYNSGSITTSYSSGTVSGDGAEDAGVGGLAGSSSGSIVASYSIGMVNGNGSVGGLVGVNYGSVAASYSTSAASGGSYVGGLVGYNYRGSIATSYSTGTVSGNEYVGGLVGDSRYGSVVASFWNVEISGRTNSAGGTGLNTAEMQAIGTYLNAGWDFVDEFLNGTCDYWQMSPGDYPRLRYHTGDKPLMPEGLGTAQEPYLIRDANDLGTVWFEPSAHYRLEVSLDLSGITWSMAIVPWFEGTFDANGNVISNLNIQGGGHLGLFRQLVSGAKIANLGLEEADIIGTGQYVGALVGRISSWGDSSAVVTNCYSTGAVTGQDRVGGLVGDNSFGSVHSSYSTCTVEGEGEVGGLVGSHGGSDGTPGGILINCYSTGMVDGERSVGGLVGQNGGFIAASCSTGAVTGSRAVGGLVGRYVFGRITTSYSSGVVSGRERVGGLVGHNYYGSIIMSYSSGVVVGTEYVGGLVGSNDYSNIVASFWDIEASGMRGMCGNQSGIGCDNRWGRTTAEMQDINTYINARWDFVDEVFNGTCDYWQISPGDYPKLRYHAGDSPVMPEGLGTAQEPYLIRDVQDLGTVWLEPTAHYRLEASVDLTGITWSMAVVPWFRGTFDGNNNVISNLHIQGSEYLGLFGQLGSGAKISDLGLEAVDVNGIADVGGLVGNNDSGSISTCYSNGTVNGTGSRVGGLVGSNSGTVSNCSSTSSISSTRWHVGGLVGSNRGSISNSYSTGTTSGETRVGGLVGGNDRDGSIATSYSTGTVSGDSSVGGLVGYTFADTITTSYSTGTVTGYTNVGGLVGWNDEGGNITSNFWDVETSGQTTSAGGIGKTTAEMQTANTFLETGWDFVDETAKGTDDIWWILEGQDYPRLWWEAEGQ